MGHLVVKVAKDEDLYMVWSSIVDNAVWIGSREELLDSSMEVGTEERITRADEKGSSSMRGIGWWEDDDFLVHNTQHRRDAGFFELRREDFAHYARHLLTDPEQAEKVLLVLAVDDHEDGCDCGQIHTVPAVAADPPNTRDDSV